jgi:hypothetical protein
MDDGPLPSKKEPSMSPEVVALGLASFLFVLLVGMLASSAAGRKRRP